MNKIILFLIGFILNSLSIALMTKGHVGQLAWSVLYRNLSIYFNISIGMALIIFSIIVYLVTCLILKTIKIKTTIIAFLFSLICGVLVDLSILALSILPMSHIAFNYIYTIVGLVFSVLSFSFFMEAQYFYPPLLNSLLSVKDILFKGKIVSAIYTYMLILLVISSTFGNFNQNFSGATIFTLVLNFTFVPLLHGVNNFFKFENINFSEINIILDSDEYDEY